MPNTNKWIKCGADYIAGDVLGWTEAVWLEPKRKTRKRKATKAGERRVIAAVLTLDGRGYVRLSVIEDKITENKFEMPLKALKRHEVIVRKRATIERGNPERLKWTDETARPHAVSRFLR